MKKCRSKIVVVCCAFLLPCALAACRRSDSSASNSNVVNSSGAQNSEAKVSATMTPEVGVNGADLTKYNAEIERLTRELEKNPGDDETNEALSEAYTKRGDVNRNARRFKEALRDYQKALRFDPENETAQQRAAELAEELGTKQHGENFEPPPPPISPDAVTEDDDLIPSKERKEPKAKAPRGKKP